MPPPIPVELVPYSPQWAFDAQAETLQLLRAFKPNMVVVHHVGSTAIPGICAKPILDLMPVVGDLSLLDDSSHLFRQLGYEMSIGVNTGFLADGITLFPDPTTAAVSSAT